MSKFKISYPSGATPIDLDELRDLIPDHAPLEVEGKTRSEYIAVLKKADEDDFVDVIKFVKS